MDSASDRISGRQWLLLGAIVAGALALWGFHFKRFFVPNVDFITFQKTAEALVSGHLPADFKRMPAYPLAFGLPGVLLPGPTPFLHAALIENLLFSAGILIELFLLARRMVGPAALIPVLIVAASPIFTAHTIQPLVEPMMGVLTLGTLLLIARGSRWAYVAAFAAALTRYECSALIALAFLADCWRWPRDWPRHLILAAAASSGFLFWMGMSVLAESAGNAYLQQMQGMNWQAHPTILWTMIQPLANPKPYTNLLLALGLLLGAVFSLRRKPLLTLVLLGFFLLYTAAHVAYGIDRTRYAFPVLWTAPLFVTVAGKEILRWLGRISNGLRQRQPWLMPVLAAGAAFLAVGWTVNVFVDFSHFESAHWSRRWIYLGFSLFVLIGAVAWGTLVLPGKRAGRVLVASGVLTLLASPVIRAAPSLSRETIQQYYAKCDWVFASRWLDRHLQPGERAVVPAQPMFQYLNPRRKPGQLLTFADFHTHSPKKFLHEARRREVDYVLFVYRPPRPENPGNPNYLRNLLYYRRYNVALMDPFRSGPVPKGFALVDTIDLPERYRVPDPVRVFRLKSAGHGSESRPK